MGADGVSKPVEYPYQRRSGSLWSGVESVNRHLDGNLFHHLGVRPWDRGDREWQGEPSAAFPPKTMPASSTGLDTVGGV